MLKMKYPKVYYQLHSILEYCHRGRAKAKDQDRMAALIEELEAAIDLIECAHMSDEYTGDNEDLADLDYSEFGDLELATDESAELDDELLDLDFDTLEVA